MSDTRVYEPQRRALLGTRHLSEVTIKERRGVCPLRALAPAGGLLVVADEGKRSPSTLNPTYRQRQTETARDSQRQSQRQRQRQTETDRDRVIQTPNP